MKRNYDNFDSIFDKVLSTLPQNKKQLVAASAIAIAGVVSLTSQPNHSEMPLLHIMSSANQLPDQHFNDLMAPANKKSILNVLESDQIVPLKNPFQNEEVVWLFGSELQKNDELYKTITFGEVGINGQTSAAIVDSEARLFSSSTLDKHNSVIRVNSNEINNLNTGVLPNDLDVDHAKQAMKYFAVMHEIAHVYSNGEYMTSKDSERIADISAMIMSFQELTPAEFEYVSQEVFSLRSGLVSDKNQQADIASIYSAIKEYPFSFQTLTPSMVVPIAIKYTSIFDQDRITGKLNERVVELIDINNENSFYKTESNFNVTDVMATGQVILADIKPDYNAIGLYKELLSEIGYEPCSPMEAVIKCNEKLKERGQNLEMGK